MMNVAPTVSVVIVTYNAASTLQKCLDSIYCQSYPSIDIIVIDGDSNDGTTDILKSNSERIYFWKSEKDNGIYDAMNKSLSHISGEWVYFLGADDELFDDFSKMANDLEDKSAIYYGSVLTRGLKRSGELDAYHQAKHGIFHQAMIYSAAVFKKYLYDTKYSIFADYELNMRCWKDKDIRFIFKDYIVANFNHTGSSDSIRDVNFEKDKSKLILRNFGVKIWLRYLIRKMKNRK